MSHLLTELPQFLTPHLLPVLMRCGHKVFLAFVNLPCCLLFALWLVVAYLSIWRHTMKLMLAHAMKTSPRPYRVVYACGKFCVLCVLWLAVAVMLLLSIPLAPIWLLIGWAQSSVREGYSGGDESVPSPKNSNASESLRKHKQQLQAAIKQKATLDEAMFRRHVEASLQDLVKVQQQNNSLLYDAIQSQSKQIEELVGGIQAQREELASLAAEVRRNSGGSSS